MLALELACVAILGVYFVAHRADPSLRRDAVLLAVAALVGEDTMIRAYRMYQYAPGWHLRVDQVPLLIPLIWAPVVLSSRAVARALRPEASPLARAALVGALVTFDASLIEPIAVRAGLWSWNEPGIFAVPVSGIVGVGLFAAAAVWLLDNLHGARRWAAIPLSVLGAHALLQLAWWGALRWVLRDAVPFALSASALGAASAAYTAALGRSGARLSWRELGPRAAATGFFAALLLPRLDASLGLWAALCTPPWLLLCARALRPPKAA